MRKRRRLPIILILVALDLLFTGAAAFEFLRIGSSSHGSWVQTLDTMEALGRDRESGESTVDLEEMQKLDHLAHYRNNHGHVNQAGVVIALVIEKYFFVAFLLWAAQANPRICSNKQNKDAESGRDRD